jgi:putative transcriptional regulator
VSKTTITAKMARDGRLTIGGRPVKPRSPEPRTDEEIERAARDDGDNPPLTRARLSKLKRVPQIKTLRRTLSLTQQEFAARYRIPIGTLRDWEQGRSQPDQPARAYLLVIARDPEGVRAALKR